MCMYGVMFVVTAQLLNLHNTRDHCTILLVPLLCRNIMFFYLASDNAQILDNRGNNGKLAIVVPAYKKAKVQGGTTAKGRKTARP